MVFTEDEIRELKAELDRAKEAPEVDEEYLKVLNAHFNTYHNFISFVYMCRKY